MPILTPQEQQVLDLITANPFVSQQELAATLGLARSTVAQHIGQLVHKGYLVGRGYVLAERSRVVCIGGATVDHAWHLRRPVVLETSNPVDGRKGFGGVARNVAESLARLGIPTSLVSILGEDMNGRALLAFMRELGVDVSQTVQTVERPTAEYGAVINPDSNLVLGIADMGIFDLFTPAHLERGWPHVASAACVFADCNLSADVLSALLARKPSARFRLVIDAVSTPKVVRLPGDLAGVDIIFMNMDEARTYLASNVKTPEAAAGALLARGAGEAVITLGAQGVLAAGPAGMVRIPAAKADPVDVTGAGDAMIAGTLYRLLSGAPLAEAAATGARLAALTTETDRSVRQDLTADLLEQETAE